MGHIVSVFSVGIRSVFLRFTNTIRRKTRSVHFGIEKGAVPPFFLKRGATAPFLRLEKRGEERGEV